MSQPASRVSTNYTHTHTHTLRPIPLHLYTHTSSPHLSQLMSYICFGLLCLSALPLSVSLYPHTLLPLLQHITIFLSAVSPPLSFFTSLSLLILHLFLSLPYTSSPLSLSFLVSAPSPFGSFFSSHVFPHILLQIVQSISVPFLFLSSSLLFNSSCHHLHRDPPLS